MNDDLNQSGQADDTSLDHNAPSDNVSGGQTVTREIETPQNPADGYRYWHEQSSVQQSAYRMSGNQIPRDDKFNSGQNHGQPYYGNQPEYGTYTTGESYYGAGQQPQPAVKRKEKKTKTRKPRKPSGFVKKALLLVAAAAVFGLVSGIIFQGVGELVSLTKNQSGSYSAKGENEADAGSASGKLKNADTPIATTPVLTLPDNYTDDVSSVVEKTMPSIVSITSTVTMNQQFWGRSYNEDVEGSGSGIIIEKNEKEILIATNNHVVEDAKEIAVTFPDNEIVKAQVRGTDAASDLAVLSIKVSELKPETLNQIKAATLGNSDDTRIGAKVIAIGNALGIGQSITVGYVSAKNRTVQMEDKSMELLQTDAAINPGNSGGALLNMSGEVIGINSVKYADTMVEGIGYAIPISDAVPIIKELETQQQITEEEQGYLGITLEQVTEIENKSYNMPFGIFIKEVAKDGAAEEAGIIKGDIITKVNGIKVKTSNALQERIGSYKKGTLVTITVMRYQDGEYKEKEFKVTLKGSESLDSLDQGRQMTPDSGQTIPGNPGSGDGGGLPNGGMDDFFDFFNQYIE